MKPIVLYSTLGGGARVAGTLGNTEKVAVEIASELDCQCVKVGKDFDPSTLNLDNYDLVLVGTGIYGGRPNSNMLNYLKKIDLKKPLQFALFITWAGAYKSDQRVFEKIRTVLESKKQRLLYNFFKCYGEGHSLFDKSMSAFWGARYLAW